MGCDRVSTDQLGESGKAEVASDLNLEGSRTQLGEEEKAAIPEGRGSNSRGQAMGRSLRSVSGPGLRMPTQAFMGNEV